MKPKLSLLFLLSFVFYLAVAQVPQGLNYQAVLRDGPTGNPILEDDVQIRFTIQTITSTIVYQETHAALTDELGAVTLVIGGGTPVGGYVFAEIDWSVELYLKTEIEYPASGTPDYDKLMGTTALKSVPYAMVAKGFTQPVEKLTVKGNTTSYEEPLFEVKNTSGNTVFAVYNEGVRIFVGDGAVKGPKGGFAIGGFGSEKDENAEKYMFVSDDSIRVYINDAPKSAKGGFAIGGYGTVKGVEWPRYMKVTSDSTRIVTTNSAQGFGVGSGSSGSYLRLTPENYFIGHGAGKSIGSGKFNSFIGYEAGKKTTIGNENIFIGYQSGWNNTDGKWNTFLGYQAGRMNTGNDNTFIGYLAGSTHGSQGGNVFIGSKAGQNETAGQQNILIGESAGSNITSGSYNVIMGFESGMSNTEGESNVFIGQSAGFSNTGVGAYIGDYNVFIGTLSGYYNTEGTSNVFIGNQSGWQNTTGRYNAFIGINAGGQTKAGNFNTYVGAQAAEGKKRGDNNVFIGVGAGGTNQKGSGNVFIGAMAGYSEQDSGLLYIENSNSAIPLIGGYFKDTEESVAINGKPVKPSLGGATFQVNGSVRLGNYGTKINYIIKASVAADLPSIAAETSYIQTYTVANSITNSSVMVSPAAGLDDGLIIQYARVSTNGTVEVKFRNTTGLPIDTGNMNWYITVIQ